MEESFAWGAVILTCRAGRPLFIERERFDSLSPNGTRSTEGSTLVQPGCMPAEVIGHECRYEIIAVIISWLHIERQGDTGFCTRLFKQFRAKLLRKEIVGRALIHKQFRKPRAVFDQCNGIMIPPECAIAAQISGERFLTPRHL